MTIGQDITPGIVTNIESLPAVSVGTASAANVMLVGQGNVSEGTAEPNTAYTITRSPRVREYFGTDTMIANAINDALNEGANPVYAVMTDDVEATETIDTQSGTFANAPITEDPSRITVDGYEVVKTLGDPADETAEGVMAYNPVYGDYAFDTTPTSVDVTYVHHDYSAAFDVLDTEEAEEIDYVYPLNENETVQDGLNNGVNGMEQFHQFAIGGVGASPLMSDEEKSNYEARFDNSRMQVFYPSRNADGETIMGAIGGLKASLGINGSAMNKRLSTHRRLIDRIDFNDEETLLNQTTVPVQSSTRGALIVDDPTMVAEDNAEESQMADGYSRFVVDNIAEIAHDNERPYVGKLNKPSARGSLQTAIRTGISFLEEQEAIVDYSVRVVPRDATSAYVDIQAETVKPLRNIYNNIAIGDY